MARDLDADMVDDQLARQAAKLATKPAIDNGVGELFEKKLSKEEKKELAAQKKAEREARKAAAAADSADAEVGKTPSTTSAVAAKSKSKDCSKAEKVRQDQELLDQELEEARTTQSVARAEGAYLGQIEAPSFSLSNPGGGPDLLERASYTLQRGRSYGLVGRNGCGKSMLLKAMASRRVGNIPPSVTVHYVSQEVQLNEKTLRMTPVDVVVNADVERRLLLEERDELIAAEARGEAIDGDRLQGPGGVLEQLQLLDVDTVETRATRLLVNLGFSDERGAPHVASLVAGGFGRCWRRRSSGSRICCCWRADQPPVDWGRALAGWGSRPTRRGGPLIVVVSHDRFFLDEVCGDVLHVSGVAKRLTQSHGSYSTWAKRRAEQQKAFARTVELRRAEIAELKAYAGHGFKYGGSSSSINKMQMKAKQAEKLEEEDAAQAEEFAALCEDVELPLALKAGGDLDGFLIQLMDVGFATREFCSALPARGVVSGQQVTYRAPRREWQWQDNACQADDGRARADRGRDSAQRPVPHRHRQSAPRRSDRPRDVALRVHARQVPRRRHQRAPRQPTLPSRPHGRSNRQAGCARPCTERRAALACRARRGLVRRAAHSGARRADQ